MCVCVCVELLSRFVVRFVYGFQYVTHVCVDCFIYVLYARARLSACVCLRWIVYCFFMLCMRVQCYSCVVCICLAFCVLCACVYECVYALYLLCMVLCMCFRCCMCCMLSVRVWFSHSCCTFLHGLLYLVYVFVVCMAF